ncbi:hypothetical protein MMC10_006590 [Thelotrema lepadinum]|nr:hypothetical protein [Thelotrema lepadinum]
MRILLLSGKMVLLMSVTLLALSSLQFSVNASPVIPRVNGIDGKVVSKSSVEIVPANPLVPGIDVSAGKVSDDITEPATVNGLPITKATWELAVFPEGEKVTLHGSLNDVIEQAKAINPNFENDFPANASSTILSINELRKRNKVRVVFPSPLNIVD